MDRQLFSIRGGISIAVALAAAATIFWVAGASAIGSSANTAVWSSEASQELTKALHHHHEVANAGDIKTLKQMYLGDEGLVTFELDPDNATPVSLRSKRDIDAHLDRVSAGLSQQGALNLDGPKMNCRATANFGVCTEECTVRLRRADGTEQVDHFFGSGTAVKVAGQWKWVQWHMSVGAPREQLTESQAAEAEAASKRRHSH